MALKNPTCYTQNSHHNIINQSKLEKSISYCSNKNKNCDGICDLLFFIQGLKYSEALKKLSESNVIQHKDFICFSLDWLEECRFQEKINIFGYGKMGVDLSDFKDSFDKAIGSEHVETLKRCCNKFRIEKIIDIRRKLPNTIIVTDENGFLGRVEKQPHTNMSSIHSKFLDFLSNNNPISVLKLQDLLGKYMRNFYEEGMEEDIKLNTALDLLHYSNGYYLGMKFQDIGYEESEILKAVNESGASIQRVYTSDYDDCYILIEQVKINIEERVATGELHKINRDAS